MIELETLVNVGGWAAFALVQAFWFKPSLDANTAAINELRQSICQVKN